VLEVELEKKLPLVQADPEGVHRSAIEHRRPMPLDAGRGLCRPEGGRFHLHRPACRLGCAFRSWTTASASRPEKLDDGLQAVREHEGLAGAPAWAWPSARKILREARAATSWARSQPGTGAGEVHPAPAGPQSARTWTPKSSMDIKPGRTAGGELVSPPASHSSGHLSKASKILPAQSDDRRSRAFRNLPFGHHDKRDTVPSATIPCQCDGHSRRYPARNIA